VTTQRRRAFALIAAIGVIAVLGLIVTALAESLRAEREVARHVIQVNEQRLALQWVMEHLHAEQPLPSDHWGDLPVSAEIRFASGGMPLYGHPAFDHRYGDRIAWVTIDGETRAYLLRLGDPPTHHALPRTVAERLTPSPEAQP